MNAVRSRAVLWSQPRCAAESEVLPQSGWRGVCEKPGSTPAEMAVEVDRAAFASADVDAHEMQWVLHAAVGPQEGPGRPVHGHIQNGIVGSNGNALQVKQNCAVTFTTWVFAAQLTEEAGVSVCAGAGTWSSTDRFAVPRGDLIDMIRRAERMALEDARLTPRYVSVRRPSPSVSCGHPASASLDRHG